MKNSPSAPAGASAARVDDLVIAERLLVEGAPRPAHGVAAGLQQDERAPMSLDRRDVADLGIEQRRVGDQREDAGGAGDVGGEAGRQAPEPSSATG